MPRNNSATQRAKRRNTALMHSGVPNLQVIGMMAEEMGRQQAEVERTGNTPERAMINSHFTGHRPDCDMLGPVCYATSGGSHR